MRSRQGRLVWILLAAAAFLLFVAVVAGALYLVLRQRPSQTTSWQDPIAEVSPDQIAPDLALYPLAGASEVETVDAAIANGDLETAYAALVYSLELTDAQRIGRLIILGARFVEAEKPERAGRSYQQVYDLAVLSPGLNDPARADALLASGKGWAGIGHEVDALSAFDQVYVLAVGSPYLQMAQRRELLAMLRTAYTELGEEARADACRDQIIRFDQQSQQPPAAAPTVPELPGGEQAVSSPEVGALEEARRQAAYALIQSTPVGMEPLPELVDSLAQALLNEDAAKLSLYQQELEGTSQPGRRIDVHWEMIRWLMVKYQVATRGFGLSLVPAWEEQAPDIQSALSTAYEDLYFEYEDLVTALPEASLMGPGSYLVRREVNLAGRLGQYPNYPIQQMADKLRDAAIELIAGGVGERLFVDAVTDGNELRFFLNPADRYGQQPQSP
jgi:hypothetical protein